MLPYIPSSVKTLKLAILLLFERKETFMMRTTELLLIAILFASLVQGSVRLEEEPVEQIKILAQSSQLLIVTTKDWNAVDGELLRYERAADQAWHPVGQKVPIAVGRNGLAWGKGLHGNHSGLARASDPIKKEGDGRAPAGIFSLSSAFGYAPREQAAKVKLPYLQATKTLECVDDSQSANYNRVLERGSVAKPDWKSSEEMRRDDELYRWGVVVDHNASPPQAGCGSCIFLHIWQGMGKGTAGCTAMNAARMEEILFWLDPQKKPLLVQLPRAEFERLRRVWDLPR
jgi:L,D-peptidoglycan transpeptidase YkuD (ErfK/YbiS/YcfS/YnhG family)